MSIWKGEVTLGQVIGFALTIFLGVIGTYVHTQVRISLLEKEMDVIQQEFDIYKEDQRMIKETLIRIEQNQVQIISLQERFQNKFDKYDDSIKDFYKNNPDTK